MQGYHRSVLLKEAISALNIRDACPAPERCRAWYLDLTLGDGGHSIEIIKRGGKVVGVDVDPQALERVQKRFKAEGIDKSKFRLIQGNFRDISSLIQKQTELKDRKYNGAIFDLGVSSLQLETPQRGFSFGKKGPIDMRMDPSLKATALDLLNILSRKELYELFYKLGEEKYSWRLADALVRARQIRPVKTTEELAGLIAREVGGGQGRIHPATKVFQALRMAVNDELGALIEGLTSVKDLIEKEGRIVVISFHSLEDRIVKNTFKEWESNKEGEIMTKKPLVPSNQEIARNPRSRSAKMRVYKL